MRSITHSNNFANYIQLNMDFKTLQKYRMFFRYIIAVFLGCVSIYLMELYKSNNFDVVAAVVLFNCIIVVSGEDASIGPVVYKSFYRSCGVCFGGFCGYMLLYIPRFVLPNHKELCLFLIPSLYVGSIQYLTNDGSGLTWITQFIKRNKAKHFILQLQVSFGVIYVGSWNTAANEADFNEFYLACYRTSAVLIGVLSLLLASIIAFPITSFHVVSNDVSTNLTSTGELFESLVHGRISGIKLTRFNHKSKAHQVMTQQDKHMNWLEKMESSRIHGQLITCYIYACCLTTDGKHLIMYFYSVAASLLPYLTSEPSWVLGMPINLMFKEKLNAKYWKPFYTVLLSRTTRIQATLTALDGNMRIDSDFAGSKRYRKPIALAMTELSQMVHDVLLIIAKYLKSPFETVSFRNSFDKQCGYGWRGNVLMKKNVLLKMNHLKEAMHAFSHTVIEEVKYFNGVRDHSETDEGTNIIPSDSTSNIEVQGGTSKHSDADPDIGITEVVDNHLLTRSELPRLRVVLGDAIVDNCWHNLHPMRTFCNLVLTLSIQVAALAHEVCEHIHALELELESEDEEINAQNSSEAHSLTRFQLNWNWLYEHLNSIADMTSNQINIHGSVPSGINDSITSGEVCLSKVCKASNTNTSNDLETCLPHASGQHCSPMGGDC